MTKTPATIFATASVAFLSSALFSSTLNSLLTSISPDAPQISTFYSILGFTICAALTLFLVTRD